MKVICSAATSYFTDDVVYWVAGPTPIGGTWTGKAGVLRAFEQREPGLGTADWGYEDLERTWYDADERVIVEIRERSWLRSAPDDVMDQRTCVVIRFRGAAPRRVAEVPPAGGACAMITRASPLASHLSLAPATRPSRPGP